MKVDIYYDKAQHEYLILTISIPPTNDEAMRSALAEMQNRDSIVTPQYLIYDVRSSFDGEEAEIDVLTHTKTENLGQVITSLKRIEMKAWGKDV